MSSDVQLEEWKELRAEALGLVQETRNLEKLAVGATGAVYAWLITKACLIADFGVFPWLIPVLFVVFGALRSFAISKHIKAVSTYLTTLEKEINEKKKEKLGWEKYFNEHRGVTYWSAAAFWVVFLIVTVAVAWNVSEPVCVTA